ncbi:hypothetical protein VTO73DRAFT_12510 [Trametes versicolor]
MALYPDALDHAKLRRHVRIDLRPPHDGRRNTGTLGKGLPGRAPAAPGVSGSRRLNRSLPEGARICYLAIASAEPQASSEWTGGRCAIWENTLQAVVIRPARPRADALIPRAQPRYLRFAPGYYPLQPAALLALAPLCPPLHSATTIACV